MLFGVAGGMADYFDADPALVRLGWVLLGLATGGVAVLVYVVMGFVMPMPDSRQTTHVDGGPDTDPVEGGATDAARQRRHTSSIVLAVGLIVVGTVFLFNNLGIFGSIRWDVVWPIAVIALGFTVLAPRLRG